MRPLFNSLSVGSSLHSPSLPVHRLDLGKRPLRYAPHSSIFMHSIATPFPWFGKAAIAVAPFLKCPSFGLYFGVSGTFLICPSKRQRPLRCALFLGSTRTRPVPSGLFWHRIDGFSGRESGHCGAPPFHTPIHYITSLLPEVETMCHIVGAPPFLVVFPRKATPLSESPVILHKAAQPLGSGKAAIAARPLPCGRLSLGCKQWPDLILLGCKVVWREGWEGWWSSPLPSCVSFPPLPPLGSSFSFVDFEVFDLMCGYYLSETSWVSINSTRTPNSWLAISVFITLTSTGCLATSASQSTSCNT